MIVSYKWLQTYFNKGLPPPGKIAEALTFGIFEVESTEKNGDDTIFDIKVLPDRAHDCLSHRGIARELAALLNTELKEEHTPILNAAPVTLSVSVIDGKLCRRYIGRVVRGIAVGPSPDWLRERLEAIGQRSINNVVDATNYVMFDIGQPLHAFDARKLDGGIVVRCARKGEHITTLDKKDIVLDEKILVIADTKDPLAVAGVKGGKKAEVDEKTTDIILEAANFDPVSVRKTSRALGIFTDSSKHFENDLTPELAREAMDRATALIMEIAGNENTIVEEVADVYLGPQIKHTIAIGAADVNRLLGTRIGDDTLEEFFLRLRFLYVKAGSPAVFTVSVPAMRLDMREKADIAEDIGHIYGYGNIPSVIPTAAKARVSKKFYYESFIRKILVEAGFSEIYCYTFAAAGEREIANPHTKEKAFLRANLGEGVKESLVRNALCAELLGIEEIKIFEMGNVFDGGGEHTSLALGVEIPRGGNKKAALEENAVREAIDLLSQKLGVELAGVSCNAWETNLNTLVKSLPEPPRTYEAVLSEDAITLAYKKISPYPFIVRDIAAWVPEGTNVNELSDSITKEGGALIARGPTLFDEFKKDGKISYAFRTVFQAHDRTLTDDEANAIMNRITETFHRKGFQVR